jgi:hypothetical protein
MLIERTDRVATEAPVGRGAATPFGGVPRKNLARSREGRDRPGGARYPATARGGVRRARWCAFSTVVADLRARLGTAEAKAADLEFALVTNRRIGIAVGILMCQMRVTEDRAFAILCKHSQDHNVKVRDLAEEVIYTGTL